MGMYEEILAETGDPDLAARIARRLRPLTPLRPNQAAALRWLRENDPTQHTTQEIADLLGVSSHQQVVQMFGSLVLKGYCRPVPPGGAE